MRQRTPDGKGWIDHGAGPVGPLAQRRKAPGGAPVAASTYGPASSADTTSWTRAASSSVPAATTSHRAPTTSDA